MASSSDTVNAVRGFVPPQNDDERRLMRRVEELCRVAVNRGIPRYTGFLSDREQSLAQAACNKAGCSCIRFWGGFDAAERRVLCIEPPDAWQEEPLAYLQCTAYGDKLPTHRDYLGAILGLGLERSCVGDLLADPELFAIFENGDVDAQIGEIMGVSAGAAVKQIAQVHCTGCGQNYKQYTYVGIHDCVAASKLPGGGDLGCAYGCLGLGSCEKACPFDAIHVIDGVARVDEEKCKACNKCVDICPRHIIALEPYKTKRHVTIPCSSHDKGVDARKVCDNGCIGCSLCAKSCPKEAITMVNNLAVIDYEKCIGCGICAQKCPRKLITVDGKVPEVKPAAPKAAPVVAED